MISIALELKKMRYMILADFRVQMLFRLGIIIQLINIAIAAASYYFITTLFRGESPIMGRYGTNVVSYILLGLTMNPVLVTSLTGIYTALESTYLTRALERIMMAPTSVYTLFFSRMSSGFFSSLITSMLYLFVGVVIFRMHIGGGNPLSALLILVLGIASTIALGMLLAQVFFYTYTGKGSGGSVILFVQTVVNVFAGAAFPVEVLPWWLRWISTVLPQTHAIRGARLVLAGHSLTDQVVLGDLLYLVGFSVIVIPVGVLLMRKGLDRLRREGYSPQTRMMGVTVFG
jgi:ABC-2 type transport system permease protein